MERRETSGATAGHSDAVGGERAADAVLFLDFGSVRIPVGGGAAGEGVDGGVLGDVSVAGLGFFWLDFLGLFCGVLFGGLSAPSEHGEYGHLDGCRSVGEPLSWWINVMEARARPATEEPPGAASSERRITWKGRHDGGGATGSL